MCYPIITPIYEKQVFINPRSSNAFRRLYHQANQCIVIIHILDEPYQRRGNHFVNAEGDSIVFRGLCCSDPIKLYNDSMWNERYFDEMADWGANVVRFAIHPSWLNQIGWERAFELYGPAITSFLDARGISFTVWCFDPHWAPMLITDWNYALLLQ